MYKLPIGRQRHDRVPILQVVDLHREVHGQAADADCGTRMAADIGPEDIQDQVAETVNYNVMLIEVRVCVDHAEHAQPACNAA